MSRIKLKLKNLVNIYNGSTPSTSIADNFHGSIAWITPKDISDQKTKYIYRGERNITEKGLREIGNKLLPNGTILFSSRAPIGLMSISKTQVSTNQGFKNLICKEAKISNEYLYYLLKTQISKIQELGSGTTFKEVSKTTLENFEIFTENDLSVQKEIASVLSALDDKIELNNRINAELEQMAKTLYDYWFVQFDFPNKEGKPYKSSGGKMVYNEVLKREIPEGWEVKSLGQIANITMGQSPDGTSYNDVGKGMTFYQGSTGFGWRFPTVRQFTTKPTRFAKTGDILLSVRAPVGTFNIAKEHCCIGRGLSALNSKDNFNSFLLYLMSYFKKRFDNINSVGTTFGSITKDDLHSLILCYPNSCVLHQFEEIVSNFDKKIFINSQQNQELAQLRDWLLPMLMNGQVTVNSDYMPKDQNVSMVAEPAAPYKKEV